jgi:hypothetical protein
MAEFFWSRLFLCAFQNQTISAGLDANPRHPMERSVYRWRKIRPLLRLFKRMPGFRELICSIINRRTAFPEPRNYSFERISRSGSNSTPGELT